MMMMRRLDEILERVDGIEAAVRPQRRYKSSRAIT